MKKSKEERVYFSINSKPHMLYELEKITVVGDKITSVEKLEPTYLQIVLGNLYKETALSSRND
jgi:hypothetical protein